MVNYAYDGGPGCGVKSGPARLFRRARGARICPGRSELPTRPLPTMRRTAVQTGRVPSRSRIVTKFSVRVQTADGSPRRKFGERGSMDADVVNYAYDGGPGDCPAVVSRYHGTGSLASRRPICLRFSGKNMGMQSRLSAKFCACC